MRESKKPMVRHGHAVAAIALLCIAVALCLFAGCSQSGSQSASEAAPSGASASGTEQTPGGSSGFSVSASDVSVGNATAGSGAKTANRHPATDAALEAVKARLAEENSEIAVTVAPLDGTDGFAIKGNRKFVAASMIKLLVLSCLLDEVERGSMSLDDEIDDLADRMIANSDNSATNEIIDMIGMKKINAHAKTLGLKQTDLQRLMLDDESGKENHISANDAASLLARFAKGAEKGDKLCKKAIGYLLNQNDKDALSIGLPSDVDFAHKTGWLDSVRHDGGIVYTDVPYVIVVLTEENAESANKLMSELSEVVYKAMSKIQKPDGATSNESAPSANDASEASAAASDSASKPSTSSSKSASSEDSSSESKSSESD